MKRVTITGADGFIGRQALMPLVERGFEVHAVSNVDPPAELLFNDVIWHKTDLLNRQESSALCAEIKSTHLLHFSWYVEHGKFWNSEKNRDWVKASLELLEGFKANGGKRVVMAGTCAEYALGLEDVLAETSACNPESLYGRSKLELMRSLADCGIDWAWGRVFFLFGPYESRNRLVASVINSLLNGEKAVCSHGRQIRDFMDVRDIASAFAALLDSDVSGPVNIASGEPITIREVVSRIALEIGLPGDVVFGAIEASKDEPKSIVADVTRLRDEVKWMPQRDFDLAIKETIGWWREERGKREDAITGKYCEKTD